MVNTAENKVNLVNIGLAFESIKGLLLVLTL